MGLIEPTDLASWRRWQASRHRLRRLRHSVRPSPPERVVLTTYGEEPRFLVAVDSGSPTSRAALLEPLGHLDVPFALLSPDPAPDLPGHTPFTTERMVDGALPPSLGTVRAAISLGHYMTRGDIAHRWSRSLGVPHLVAQHGALTPFMPPLPVGAHVLAWSEADAGFWASGRSDVTHDVVGSQLLFKAGIGTHPDAPPSELIYLGQMHGAELSRSRLVRAAASFCREHGATYRPHPSERDKLSVLAHDGYRRLGIRVEGSTPLAELTGPVVSVFSTGVLEAAAQGRDAWVDFPSPPAWLGEFWERYGMHRFGDSPTPAPVRPILEPARRIAELLTAAVG
ncbi:MAG: prephenate dehydrogenase [Nocardioides sp.]|uniref:prephenate dehydrogenase n=1 Tax=Nocardioides sp. TaxID=35761 RepID=UPI0032656686